MGGPAGETKEGGFRGFTAPASLKRAPCPAPGLALLVGFPGLYRPGLIEAPVLDHGDDLGVEGFRGFTAPASLKRAVALRAAGPIPSGFRGFTAPASLKQLIAGVGVQVALEGFRGFTAPASLKQLLQGSEDVFLRRGFRGFTAPASLKPTPPRRQPRPLRVSGALPPRPH